MAGNRIGRVNEDMQRELSALLRTMKDPRVHGGLVSVTAVDTAQDLSVAKVYISVLERDAANEVMAGLRSASGYLRSEIAKALSLRHAPELVFAKDDSIDKGAHIIKLLRDLDTPEE